MCVPERRHVCGRLLCIQDCNCALFMAPDWRAISLPWWNRMTVGIPRIPSSLAACGCCSVLSFAKITGSLPPLLDGCIVRDAEANSGAIILHGPHHGAQKSTSTGISLFVVSLRQVCGSNSSGSSDSKELPHWPHFGSLSSLSAGDRLI